MKQSIKNFLLIFLFVSSSVANAGTQKLTGVIQLNGKQLPVGINFTGSFGKNDQIIVGSETFSISDAGRDGFGGRRLVQENGKNLVDKNISIATGVAGLESIKKDPASTAKDFDLVNKAEFQCNKEDNALLIIADNKSGEIIANCLVLQ